MNGRWRLAEDVLLTGEPASRFLTRVSTGETFALNETASAVVDLAVGGASQHEIVMALRAARPDAREREVWRDVRDVLQEVARLALVVPE
ncbi:MAG TPA: PqqD family peptide modification chaperone [Candidatus Thermoplasmatota archaeon]|nr:PqqD family peptide modification chaperone [Candidatus Thermoplasmatota archaeon]